MVVPDQQLRIDPFNTSSSNNSRGSISSSIGGNSSSSKTNNQDRSIDPPDQQSIDMIANPTTLYVLSLFIFSEAKEEQNTVVSNSKGSLIPPSCSFEGEDDRQYGSSRSASASTLQIDPFNTSTTAVDRSAAMELRSSSVDADYSSEQQQQQQQHATIFQQHHQSGSRAATTAVDRSAAVTASAAKQQQRKRESGGNSGTEELNSSGSAIKPYVPAAAAAAKQQQQNQQAEVSTRIVATTAAKQRQRIAGEFGGRGGRGIVLDFFCVLAGKQQQQISSSDNQ
eukprot:CAMPEP_0201278168 /NCGR_PEP_ID=MMETSP0853-20130426/59979_1 /ASSEMBLY_ACC=CAM_ASM_000640 /TAXON_ID=183588 /ORGANISM="Pseudo-nitzschia fraudulenta, Strain WWA7" /LENGTH=281 /DNA_ID=CAMNT_0047586449 /DNA_START=465 /DNA_END=1311 /DNA_ORIENTATION=+